MLILSGTRTVLPRRPPGIVTRHDVNWNHWAARDLRGLFLPGVVRQPTICPVGDETSANISPAAGATFAERVIDGVPVPVGRCNGSGEYINLGLGGFGPAGYFDSDSGRWMLALKLHRYSGTGSDADPFLFVLRRWGLALHKSTSTLALATNDGSAHVQDLNVTVNANSYNSYAVSHDGSNARVFKGGVYQRQEAIVNPNTTTDSSYARFSWDGTFNYVEADYEWGAFWKGTASDDVMAWAHDHLYELFDRPPRRIYFDVAGGGVAVTPSAASAAASGVDPTVVAGSLALGPEAASAAGSAVAPTVVAGSLSLTPGAAAAAAGAQAPTVVEGGVTLTPAAAAAAGSAVAPTVRMGSVAVTPAVAAVVAAGADPIVVAGSLSLTPAAAGAAATAVSPTVDAGGAVTVTPAVASAVTAALAPTVVAGSLALSPEAAAAAGSAVPPTVVAGALALSPAAASALASAHAPTVLSGAVAVTPAVASAATSASVTVVVTVIGVPGYRWLVPPPGVFDVPAPRVFRVPKPLQE